MERNPIEVYLPNSVKESLGVCCKDFGVLKRERVRDYPRCFNNNEKW